MRRSALILSILALTAGCDKATPAKDTDLPPAPSFDVASRPPLVFQAFGSLDSTMLVPIAAIINGEPKAIVLPTSDWRRLDSLYFQAGTSYPIYRDGRPAGTVTVTRRMWEPDSEPLYALPGCPEVRPMAAVTLKTTVPLDPAFEFLSLSVPRAAPAAAPAPPRDLMGAVRAITLTALKAEQLDAEDIDTASFSARAIHVGGAASTLVASQVDANAGDSGPGAGHTTHFLFLGDDVDGRGFVVSYRHFQSGESRTVEFQRLIDHLDINGDGTDEAFLESWRYAGTNELVLLQRAAGKWHVSLRVPQNWCVREKRK